MNQPGKISGQVCHFLGVECDSEFLNFHQKQSGGDASQENLRRPIDSGQKGKWRKQLRGRGVAKVEHVCGESGWHYNYEPLHGCFPLSMRILSLGGVLVGDGRQFPGSQFFHATLQVESLLAEPLQEDDLDGYDKAVEFDCA